MQDLLALRLADPILAPPGLKTRGEWLSPTLLMIVIAADAPRKKRAAIALGNPFRNQGTTTTRSVRMSGADSPKSEVSFCGTQARSSKHLQNMIVHAAQQPPGTARVPDFVPIAGVTKKQSLVAPH
jgi:hypothetical protein